MSSPGALAARLIGHLDLTSLGADDTDSKIEALCARATTPVGAVAAVCILPRFVPLARRLLEGTDVRVATVANFPAGGEDPEGAAQECATAVAAGADEVDIVLPYRAWLAGDHRGAARLVGHCRDACGAGRVLKVIIETGAFDDPHAMQRAAADAIVAGADFVKTSTGTLEPGATPEAAGALLAAVRDAIGQEGRTLGFKAAGGIRTMDQALTYLNLAEEALGTEHVDASTFRIGASGLLDDLLSHTEGTQ